MPGIFICYRRDDAAGWAGRLDADLQAGLPGVDIFRDIDDIPPGVKYSAYIANAVGSCDVLIALIGPQWLTAGAAAGGRRLDDPDDFIRLEITAGLQRDIRVIPALVGGAKLPAEADLPADIRPLVQRQAYELSDHRWPTDCQKLIAALRPLVKPGAVATRTRLAAVAVVAALGLGGYALWQGFSGSVPSPTSPAGQGASPALPAVQGASPTPPPAQTEPPASPAGPGGSPGGSVAPPSGGSPAATPVVTRTATPTGGGAGGVFEFRWPGSDCWNIYRADQEVSFGCGPGKQALAPGTYSIRPRSASPFLPFDVSIEAGSTTKVDYGGLLDFNWRGGDCWNVLRDGKEVAFGCGAGKLGLGPGNYMVQGRSNPIFLPFTVSIKTGATTTVDIGGVFEFAWPGPDCWNVYRGDQEVIFGCGAGKQALGAGQYTIRPRSNPIFAPFEITIKDGATVKR